MALFRVALNREAPDFAALHLHGPGGMGKTRCCVNFAQIAAKAGRLCVPLDGR